MATKKSKKQRQHWGKKTKAKEVGAERSEGLWVNWLLRVLRSGQDDGEIKGKSKGKGKGKNRSRSSAFGEG
jgi:hypothetical protein